MPADREALQDLRIVDLSGTVGTAFCARLFAVHGAEVVNLEPPSVGHPTRWLRPFATAVSEPDSSALHAYLSARKRSVVADLSTDSGRRRVLELCREADVVLQAFPPGELETLGLGLEQLQGLNPTLLVASLSWYGATGPCADAPGNDALIASMCGAIRGFGPPEGPPMLPSGCQAQILGGICAFVGVMTRLLGRERKRRGSTDPLDVSLLESSLCLTEPGVISVFNSGELRPRLGYNRFWPTYPASIYPCRDGWIGVTALTPSQWKSLCKMLELPARTTEPPYLVSLERLHDADLLDELVAPALLRRTAEEWFHEGQERRIPLALVPTVQDMLGSEQFQERRAFAAVEIGDGGSFQAPTIPFRLSRTPAKVGQRAARLGEDSDFRFAARRRGETASDRGENAECPDPSRRPNLLEGIRIIDLTMGWAGPLAARHAADMGAEVIKVESCVHFDWWRGWDATAEGLAAKIHEKAAAFNMVNRNKLGITLELTSDAGKDLFKRLVGTADAVVENYASTVLPKLGLSYETLCEIQPSLVMLSMPPFGAVGPWKGFRAYGSTIEQASGLPHFQGEESSPPLMQHVALGDPVAGITGAAALLVGLWHLQQTGEGQLIDLSHVESLFPLGIQGILEVTLNGRPAPRLGRRHERHAPHGIFPCRGQDRWITITVTHEEHWRSLIEYMATGGRPALWPQEDRFATAQGRKEHEDELDRRLGEWTAQRDRHLLAAKLRRLGVPTAPVLDGGDLLFETQLTSRGFWQWLDRDHVGSQPHPSAPYRDASGPAAIDFPAPTLGQHNSEVLGSILGLSAKEIEDLESQGVIGCEPRVP